MANLKFALLGAGFWSHFQLAAWRELPGVECVGVCDPVQAKAEALAGKFGIAQTYRDPEELFRHGKLDFVDIVSSPDTHSALVHLAARHRVPVICQKPMALSLSEAEEMVSACREAGVPFFVHENWRWQTAIRQLKKILAGNEIGRPFRARIDMISAFNVFANQPALKEIEQFILTDVGTHILDVARFLFGEAESVYCLTNRIHHDIRGEDVATVTMKMSGPTTVICEMGFAGSPLEEDRFPETFIFVEGDEGSVRLASDFWIRVTTREGTFSRRYPPEVYSWVDPAYSVVQSSIVPCHANILGAIRRESAAETTGEDNLKTLRLVFGAYQSATTGEVNRGG